MLTSKKIYHIIKLLFQGGGLPPTIAGLVIIILKPYSSNVPVPKYWVGIGLLSLGLLQGFTYNTVTKISFMTMSYGFMLLYFLRNYNLEVSILLSLGALSLWLLINFADQIKP